MCPLLVMIKLTMIDDDSLQFTVYGLQFISKLILFNIWFGQYYRVVQIAFKLSGILRWSIFPFTRFHMNLYIIFSFRFIRAVLALKGRLFSAVVLFMPLQWWYLCVPLATITIPSYFIRLGLSWKFSLNRIVDQTSWNKEKSNR